MGNKMNNNYGLPYQPKSTLDTIPDPPTSGSNISQESKGDMPVTWYHFIFSNGALKDVKHATSFKDAIWEIAKHLGDASEMFRKCLKGYDESDITGIVKLFNHFAYPPIDKVYVISAIIYE